VLDQGEIPIGQTGFLRPQTKQASAECYARLAAVIVSYDEWPYVWVRVFDQPGNGHGREIKVHRDNIGKRRRTAQRDKGGDMAGGDDQPAPTPKPRKHEIAPSTGYEEPMLF
jgi:hypothetical protein